MRYLSIGFVEDNVYFLVFFKRPGGKLGFIDELIHKRYLNRRDTYCS